MAERIFISFSSTDQIKASAICEELERNGLRCWISSRDVPPGDNYQAAIVQALQSAKALVLIFSSHTNASQEVSKELSLASALKLQVIPVRIEDVMPQGALRYELATRQWVNAFDAWGAAVSELVASLRLVAAAQASNASVPAPPPVSDRAPSCIPQQAIETARAALTHYIGPIASLLVRKAASSAISLDDFHDRLASKIQSSEERSAFLSRIRRRLT